MSKDQSQKKKKGTDEWMTPRYIIEALGPFDLDVAAPEVQPWPTAARTFTKKEDGLKQPWKGLVWMNPPYSNVYPWMRALSGYGNGIALVPASTGSRAWQDFVLKRAAGIAFLRGRTVFCKPDGTPAEWGAGYYTALVAYGNPAAERIQAAIVFSSIDAVWVPL